MNKMQELNEECSVLRKDCIRLNEENKKLRKALQDWENFFYHFDDGDDFPNRICLDYTMESGVRSLLIKGRRVLKNG